MSMNTLGSTKSILVHHDWMNTDVYVACKNNVPRYKKPSVGDPRSVQITSYITILRSNPQQHQKAHELIDMFNFAIDFLEKVLSYDCN